MLARPHLAQYPKTCLRVVRLKEALHGYDLLYENPRP